jgi:hypothetical protein
MGAVRKAAPIRSFGAEHGRNAFHNGTQRKQLKAPDVVPARPSRSTKSCRSSPAAPEKGVCRAWDRFSPDNQPYSWTRLTLLTTERTIMKPRIAACGTTAILALIVGASPAQATQP